ncbi:MAG TPA: hypothetical protein VLA66_08475, partial [Thermoanaerobaculia bacterium]|nr:hypothetical protein [Thermoanaerobaculia bacterium]
FVYAEHFIEHLTFPDAIAFLRSAHGALAARGRIRLSTPSLEWVWATHDPNAETPAEVLRRTFVANRAFYGWQHRFVWTRDLLAEAVEACGSREPRFFGYGESETPELRGLEQHDTYEERPDLPHVLVVEAGKGERDPARLERLLAVARESFLDHLRG